MISKSREEELGSIDSETFVSFVGWKTLLLHKAAGHFGANDMSGMGGRLILLGHLDTQILNHI